MGFQYIHILLTELSDNCHQMDSNDNPHEPDLTKAQPSVVTLEDKTTKDNEEKNKDLGKETTPKPKGSENKDIDVDVASVSSSNNSALIKISKKDMDKYWPGPIWPEGMTTEDKTKAQAKAKGRAQTVVSDSESEVDLDRILLEQLSNLQKQSQQQAKYMAAMQDKIDSISKGNVVYSESPIATHHGSNKEVEKLAVILRNAVPIFKGDSATTGDAQEFISKLKHAHEASTLNERQFGHFIHSKLSGVASSWYEETCDTIHGFNASFDLFVECFQKQFIPDDADFHNFMFATEIKQGNKTTSEYATEFTAAIGLVKKLPDFVKVVLFIKGLAPRIQHRLQLQKENIATLNSIIRHAMQQGSERIGTGQREMILATTNKDKDKNIICFNCFKKGHTEEVCRKPKRKLPSRGERRLASKQVRQEQDRKRKRSMSPTEEANLAQSKAKEPRIKM